MEFGGDAVASLGGLRKNGFLNPDAAQRHYFCHPITDENSIVLRIRSFC